MNNNYDLVIIGGGPAGMSAGIYAARQDMRTMLITKDFGGQIAKKAVKIENYLGFNRITGMDLIKKFKNHLKSFKIDSKYGSVKKIEKKEDIFLISIGKKKISSKSIIIASGADPRPLEVPGEKKYIGKGISYCTICDGPLYKDKTVAIIGGGNSGLESALFISKFAKKIYVLEYENKLGADKILRDKVSKDKKIEIIYSAELERVKGDKFVKSILWKDRRENRKKKTEVEGVFVEVGHEPATSFVKNLVDFSKRDEIKIDPITCQTKTPGLFAAGDVTDVKYKQIIIAAGEGAKASLSVYKYLNNRNN